MNLMQMLTGAVYTVGRNDAIRIDTNYQFSNRQIAMGRHGYISTYDYELDSGCYFFRLLYRFWKTCKERSIPVSADRIVTLLKLERFCNRQPFLGP